MKTLKPSDFRKDPMGSVTRKSECEDIARNIMVILARTGDVFRKLPYEEYVSERKKDGNFSSIEKSYFDKVIDYCISEDSAKLFSPVWHK